jgi:hypothetical protein
MALFIHLAFKGAVSFDRDSKYFDKKDGSRLRQGPGSFKFFEGLAIKKSVHCSYIFLFKGTCHGIKFQLYLHIGLNKGGRAVQDFWRSCDFILKIKYLEVMRDIP